jgi:D-arabinose 1-dehydrogenase-like Zn-dependent alcohol dehydrogenase
MQERSDQLPASRSRAVRLDSFGGPEVLDIREVPAPQAGPGQVRVRVTAAGLNPMDWFMTADADTAVRFGLSLPAGFGTDYAGVVDQVGDGVTGFAPGDRVFGGALSRAVANFVVVDPTGGIAANEAHHTPDGVDDRTAATLTIAGRTASAALAVVELGPDDTVTPGAHRRKLPGRANPHCGRAPGRPAREGQGRHRPLGKRPAQAWPALFTSELHRTPAHCHQSPK